MQTNQTKGLTFIYITAIVAVTLWGFSFVWTNGIIKADIPIFTFLFVRLSIAGTLLWIFSKLTGKLQKINLRDFGLLSLMAFFEPFIYFIAESFGMKATGSAVITAVVIATIPIVCLVTERIMDKTPITPLKLIGILITVPGIVMVVLKDGNISVENGYGIALLFIAVLSAVGYAAVVKKLSVKFNSFTIATYQFLLGAAMFIPFFLGYGLDGLTPKLYSPEILYPLLSLAILCSCVAFVLWVSAIRGLGITKANIFSALIPAISAIGAAITGQESLTIISFAGISIVIMGVILAQR